MKERLRINKSVRAGRVGYMISGPDGHGARVHLWTTSFEIADTCRDKIRQGKEITMADLTGASLKETR